MLQYPTNVYPQNIAVDLFSHGLEPDYIPVKFSFIFNGSKLSHIYQNFYDSETYNSIYTKCEDFTIPKYFNGDKVAAPSPTRGEINTYFSQNKEYIYNYILGQTDDEGNNDYSIYIGRGKLLEDSTDKTVLHIKDKISNIYGFTTATSRTPLYISDVIAFGMTIVIGTETRVITNYDYNTGTLKVNSAFTGTLNKNTPYKLYSNYLITPYYYFKTIKKPSVLLNVDTDKNMIHCTGEYTQRQNVSIKYYILKMWRDGNVENYWESGRVMYETNRIYSEKIEQYFPDYFPGIEYNVSLIVCNQDNFVTSTTDTFTIPKYEVDVISNATVEYIPSAGAVRIRWKTDSESYHNFFPEDNNHTISGAIYREDVHTGEVEYLISMNLEKQSFDDFKTQNTKEYKYMIVPFKGNIVKTNSVKIDDVDWIIAKITLSENSNFFNRIYTISAGDIWKFSAEVEDTTIVQNTNKTLHVGSAQYPLISHSDTQYMSGTLTAMLGHMNCETSEFVDNIELITAWRKFITRDAEYLLKSPKGDIWVVGITDSPSTSYDESSVDILTKFTFSWAELRSVKECCFTSVGLG